MVRLQDDFYDALNGEWAATAVIPEDKARTGSFVDLADEIEDLFLKQTDQWLAGEDLPQDSVLSEFVAFHRLAADYDQRDADGVAPVLPLLETYKNLASYEDYCQRVAEFEMAGTPNLFPFGVAPDFMNARINVLWADAPGTILPDTSYYADDHPQKEELLALWRSSMEDLLAKFPFSEEEVADLLDKRLELDRRIASVVLSQEESSEYAKLYHPYQWEDFKKLVPGLPLGAIFQDILGQEPDQVIVPEERFWQASELFYSEEAWPYLKATLILGVIDQADAYLTDEIRVLSGAYSRALSGTPLPMNAKKAAYYLAQGPFSQALGLWYAEHYFSPEAKADVEAKIERMIAVYKNRLESNDWLSPETRDKAIVKLNSIRPYIGYPEELPARYYQKKVDPALSLFENAQALGRLEIAHAWSKWNQEVDDKEWGMPAHMVNAYYNPQKNLIVFPAAILQAPFYSLEASSSANYGGIGAVIAHEISHAFDTNGASFDENGSLNNWWTQADYDSFQEKTQKVVDLFEGQDSYGAKVNGKLTVSENVADLGGLSAALEAAKQDPDYSATAFFENHALIWRMKGREEFMQMMAAVDVHAPAKLRVNLQLPNFEEFHQTFQVTEADGMWRQPEDRIEIW